MSIIVGCNKCGKGIEVDDETLALFAKNSQPVSTHHETCPDETADHHDYRFVIEVYKDGEKIASAGETLRGSDFDSMFPNITKSINKQWERVGERAALADMDPQ